MMVNLVNQTARLWKQALAMERVRFHGTIGRPYGSYVGYVHIPLQGDNMSHFIF